jgi:branched-chain amino acid transport system ATP-binding protein
MSHLRFDDVTVSFGGLAALNGVSLTVTPGAVTGLIGPNGAGKTTLFNVATGLQRPSSGRVFFGERDITRASPVTRARLGLGRTFQHLETFASLTVRDNLLVALEARRRVPWSGRDCQDAADGVLERLHLTATARVHPDRLSTGTARLVGLGVALAGRPRVLLLDEPSAGLDDTERATLSGVVRDLADRDGLAILLVEHDMTIVNELCDTIYVLDFGRLIARGTADELHGNEQVRRAYLGSPAPSRPGQPASQGGDR